MFLCGQCLCEWDTPYYDKKIWYQGDTVNQGDYLGIFEKLLDCPQCLDDTSYVIDKIAYPKRADDE